MLGRWREKTDCLAVGTRRDGVAYRFLVFTTDGKKLALLLNGGLPRMVLVISNHKTVYVLCADTTGESSFFI